MKKKLLATLLSFAMLFSLLPVSALAVDPALSNFAGTEGKVAVEAVQAKIEYNFSSITTSLNAAGGTVAIGDTTYYWGSGGTEGKSVLTEAGLKAAAENIIKTAIETAETDGGGNYAKVSAGWAGAWGSDANEGKYIYTNNKYSGEDPAFAAICGVSGVWDSEGKHTATYDFTAKFSAFATVAGGTVTLDKEYYWGSETPGEKTELKAVFTDSTAALAAVRATVKADVDTCLTTAMESIDGVGLGDFGTPEWGTETNAGKLTYTQTTAADTVATSFTGEAFAFGGGASAVEPTVTQGVTGVAAKAATYSAVLTYSKMGKGDTLTLGTGAGAATFTLNEQDAGEVATAIAALNPTGYTVTAVNNEGVITITLTDSTAKEITAAAATTAAEELITYKAAGGGATEVEVEVAVRETTGDHDEVYKYADFGISLDDKTIKVDGHQFIRMAASDTAALEVLKHGSAAYLGLTFTPTDAGVVIKKATIQITKTKDGVEQSPETTEDIVLTGSNSEHIYNSKLIEYFNVADYDESIWTANTDSYAVEITWKQQDGTEVGTSTVNIGKAVLTATDAPVLADGITALTMTGTTTGTVDLKGNADLATNYTYGIYTKSGSVYTKAGTVSAAYTDKTTLTVTLSSEPAAANSSYYIVAKNDGKGESDYTEITASPYEADPGLQDATITIDEPGTITYDAAQIVCNKKGTSGADLTYTYEGDPTAEPTVKFYADADKNNEPDGEGTSTPPTNAGTYLVGVSAAATAQYKAVAEVKKQFTITPASVTITPASGQKKEYGAADPTLPYTTSIDAGATELDSAFTTATAGMKLSYQDSQGADTPAGTYEITLGTFADTTNFSISLSSTPVNFTVNKKAVALTDQVQTSQAILKGKGEFQDPELDAKYTAGNGTFKYGTTNSDAEITKDHAGMVEVLKSADSGGTIYFIYTIAASNSNYSGTIKGSIPYTISNLKFYLKDGTTELTVEHLTIETAPTYGAQWSEIVKFASNDNSVANLVAKDSEEVQTGAFAFDFTATDYPTAGDRTWKLTFTPQAGTAVTVLSGSVTVKAKELKSSDLELSEPSPTITKVYDGTKTVTTSVKMQVKDAATVNSDAPTITSSAEYAQANAAEEIVVTFTPQAITQGNYTLAATETLTCKGAITPATHSAVTHASTVEIAADKTDATTVPVSPSIDSPYLFGTCTYDVTSVTGHITCSPAVGNGVSLHNGAVEITLTNEAAKNDSASVVLNIHSQNYGTFTYTINVTVTAATSGGEGDGGNTGDQPGDQPSTPSKGKLSAPGITKNDATRTITIATPSVYTVGSDTTPVKVTGIEYYVVGDDTSWTTKTELKVTSDGTYTVGARYTEGSSTVYSPASSSVKITAPKDEPVKITGFVKLDGVSVSNGTTEANAKKKLPTTVTANLNNGKTAEIKVTSWTCSDYKATTKGTYTFTAALDIGEYEMDSDVAYPTVIVTVKAASSSGGGGGGGGSSSESSGSTGGSSTGGTPSAGSTTSTDNKGTVTESNTTITTNADGSQTATTNSTATQTNGTVTESKTETVINKDGSSTATTTATSTQTNGDVTTSETKVTTNTDGSSTATTTATTQAANGTVITSETKVTTNTDGSSTATTTATATTASGAVTETKTEVTTAKDGSSVENTTAVTTKADGTTTTVTAQTTTATDGSATTTATSSNGSSGTIVTDKTGTVTKAEASVTAGAAAQAAASGTVVTLPVSIETSSSAAKAPEVKLSVPETSAPVKVEVPVDNLTPGTVLMIVDENGKETIVPKSVVTEDGVALEVKGNVTLKVVDNTKTFNDTSAINKEFQNAVAYVSSRELFNGTTKETFAPNTPMTRQMLFTVMARLDGADTSNGAYAKGMAWAVENGISDGTRGAENLNRQQLATMLYRYAGEPKVEGNKTADFKDAGNVSNYAKAAMEWCVQQGILNGNAGNLNPTGPATRAQVATMLMRFNKSMI